MHAKNPTLGGGGFHHVAIRARDFDASVRFYTDVLGFTPKIAWGEEGKRAIMLDTGDGNYIEIFERPGQHPVSDEGPILHFAFRTDNTDAALERARTAGCPVTMEPKTIEISTTTHGPGKVPVRMAFVKGPDGEVIEFFQNDLT